MKQNATFSAQSFIASCVTSSLIIVWKGHSSLYSKHQFHKNKVFRRGNPFSSDELGTDVRQRCSCFPTVSFLRPIMLNVTTGEVCSAWLLVLFLLPHPLSCRLTYLSAIHICSRSVFSTSARTLISSVSSLQESLSWMLGACLPKIATTHHQ